MAEKINNTREVVKTHEGDNKLDKSSELNDTMTIIATGKDEYENTIKNIGGK